MELPLFFLLAICITAPQAYSQYFHFADWHCQEDVGNFTSNGKYQNNLLALLPSLTNQASLSSFGNSILGEGIDRVHALYSCRGDLNSQQCHDCVKEASQEIITRCPSQIESIQWFEECMVRYANRVILSLEEESPFTWGYNGEATDDSSPYLAQIVAENIDGLIEGAAYDKASGGYALGQVNIAPLGHVYILVQCTPDILGRRCEKCLRATLMPMAEYGNMSRSTPLMILYPSCHIRYDRSSVLLNGAKYSPISRSNSLLPPLPTPPPATGGSNARLMIKSYWDLFIRSLGI